MMKSFAELFKKYRLRAEFDTFTAFGNVLAENGYNYEDSIFSHWQKGARIPSSRTLVLTIIKIFSEKEALKTIEEANAFLVSAGMGYLTKEEVNALQLKDRKTAPFQVPNEIVHFIGRKEILKEISKEIDLNKKILLYGPAGIGKTAIAIKLGHTLRHQFPDGVLWYRVDSSNIMDILFSIAYLFGENIGKIKSVEVRASIVRTLLRNKKVLFIFDNVSTRDSISLLLPNTSTCAVIVTSQENFGTMASHYRAIKVPSFTQEELLRLFEIIFDRKYVEHYKKVILEIGEKLGNLPLATHISAHIIATYTKKDQSSIDKYLTQFDLEAIDLKTLHYEDKNLFKATTLAFNTLDEEAKNIFISLGVFEGKDFSLDAVCAVNNLSIKVVESYFQQLRRISFVQEVSSNRYSLHPILRIFARQKMVDSSFYLRAAKYYEKQLGNYQEKQLEFYPEIRQETDNIIYIFKKCYEFQYWDPITNLWNSLEHLLQYTKEIDKLRPLAESVFKSKKINIFQKVLLGYYVGLAIFWSILYFNNFILTVWNDIWNFGFAFLPFLGGIFGLLIAKSWGFFKSYLGKAITFLSLGLVSWGVGDLVVVYYNLILSMRHPYPSYSDIFFIPSFIFFAIGITFLSQAAGTKYNILRKKGMFFLLGMPSFVFLLSFFFLSILIKEYGFLSLALPSPQLLVNIVYAFIFIILLTLALIIFGLSLGFFGGRYKVSMYSFLFGFITIYLSVAFLYTMIATDTNYNGTLNDLVYAGGFLLITFGVWGFYKPNRLPQSAN